MFVSKLQEGRQWTCDSLTLELRRSFSTTILRYEGTSNVGFKFPFFKTNIRNRWAG